MEWFALSSTYWMDPKFEGISATTERLFTRLLGYCRLNNNGGIMPQSCYKLVSLPRSSRNMDELITRQIVHVRDDGMYEFPAWETWQQYGDDLEERKKKDRDRKREERRLAAAASEDNPGQSRGTEQNKTEQDNSTYVESTPHVPAASEETRGPAVPVDGWKIVKANTPTSLGSTVQSALALEASTMLRGGATEQQVADCLLLWMQKPDAGVRLLPHLLANVVKARNLPAGNQAGGLASKADIWAATAEHLRNTEHRMELES